MTIAKDNEDERNVIPEAGENELGALLSADVEDIDSDGDGSDTGEAPLPVPGESAPAAPVPTPTPTPAAVPSPVAAPVPAPVVPAPVAAVAPPAPAAPAPVAPVVQPQPQPAPLAAPESQPVDPAAAARESYQRFRGEAEETLANSHYALPAEVLERFAQNDFSDIPKMMARVYMDAHTASVAYVNTHFPNMLENTSQVQAVHKQAETKFFEAWPQLNVQTHGADIQRFGRSYRQMYPDASADDFIRDVGAQVVVALKIPTPAVQQQPNGAAPAGQQPRAQPFTPASGKSGGSPPIAAPKGSNIFAQLSEEVDELDLD